MGTVLHRIETCLAVGIQIGSPCFVDDTNWQYDSGNLSKYYNDTQVCSSAMKRNREKFYSLGVKIENAKYVLSVPLAIKTALDYCHENLAAWYRGVILKHMLHFTASTEQSMTKLLKESRLMDSKTPDISQITSVHMRSTDTRSHEKVLPPRQAIVFFSFCR